MAFRKGTIRKLSPVTRDYAKLLNELDSIVRRGKNLVEKIARLELDSQALAHAKGLPATPRPREELKFL